MRRKKEEQERIEEEQKKALKTGRGIKKSREAWKKNRRDRKRGHVSNKKSRR